MSKPKYYTPPEFARKIKVSRSTIYRWVDVDQIRFKMYDAEVVEIAGKKFIRTKS